MSNCWLNSYGKFGGATRRRFFAICEKPQGGMKSTPPPPVRGLRSIATSRSKVGSKVKVWSRSNKKRLILILRGESLSQGLSMACGHRYQISSCVTVFRELLLGNTYCLVPSATHHSSRLPCEASKIGITDNRKCIREQR